MRVLVKVPLSPYSGYGRDGIGIVRALIRWGADVYIEPMAVQAPLPEDVALLLTKPLEAPFDLVIVHVDPMALEASPELRRSAPMVVGWTMWESSNFGNLSGRSSLRKRLKGFDTVIGYDEVSSDCLRPYTNKPILTLQGGFDPEDWPKVERDWTGERFSFAMVGQLHDRKSPFVSIKAFQELKAEYPEEFEPAELHLKNSLRTLHPKLEEIIPKCRVHYAVWPNEILREFYTSQHVLLAPSKGEGKNMPALEFQSTGGTVIATNWGGHRGWLNPDYNYALNYTLRPVDPKHPNTFNAHADVAHLKELMLHIFRNRSEVKLKGDMAAQIIPQLASWDNVIERLFLRLADNVEGGKALFAKAQSCRIGRES